MFQHNNMWHVSTQQYVACFNTTICGMFYASQQYVACFNNMWHASCFNLVQHNNMWHVSPCATQQHVACFTLCNTTICGMFHVSICAMFHVSTICGMFQQDVACFNTTICGMFQYKGRARGDACHFSVLQSHGCLLDACHMNLQ